jgi:hypothetical protein
MPPRSHRSYSPERFLAIAAGAHLLIDALPSTAYPITDWGAMKRVVLSVQNCSLRAPGGDRIEVNDMADAVERISQKVRVDYFPVTGPDDLAHKAGLVLVGLVMFYHAPRQETQHKSPDFEEGKARIQTSLRTHGG